MRLTTILRTAVAFSLLLTPAVVAHADELLNSDTGILRIFVEDETGAAVANAPVYLSDGQKTEYLQTDALGLVSLDAQEGKYDVSSATSKPGPFGESVDRYVSPTAHVRLIAQDASTVVLILRPLETSVFDLSASALRKIGVADEVEKYTN